MSHQFLPFVFCNSFVNIGGCRKAEGTGDVAQTITSGEPVEGSMAASKDLNRPGKVDRDTSITWGFFPKKKHGDIYSNVLNKFAIPTSTTCKYRAV